MTISFRNKLRASAATAAALLALGAAPVSFAQDGEATGAAQETPAGAGASQTVPLFTEIDTGPDDASGDGGGIPLVLASSLIGQPVFNLNGVEEVGQVSDLAVGADGTFAAFVLTAGGREVSVERGEIAWVEFEPGRRVLAMNAAAGRLDALSEFDRAQVVSDSGGLNGAPGGETARGATGQGGEQNQAQAGEEAQPGAEGGDLAQTTAEDRADPAAQAADRALLRGSDGMTDGVRPLDASPQTMDGFATTGNNQPQQIQGDVAGAQAAGEALDPPQPPLTAENVEGLRVFGPEAEEIGSVTGVVFSPEGEIEAVVVETGGFLGIGSHEIAVDFARVAFVEQAGMRAVQLDVTEAQMRDHPSYDADAYRDGQENTILR